MALPRRLAWIALILAVALPLLAGIPGAHRAASLQAVTMAPGTSQGAPQGTKQSGATAQPPAASGKAATSAEPVVPAGELRTSDLPSSGLFTPAKLRSNAPDLPAIHTYAVLVETTLPVDADAVANEIQATLTDPRGWQGWEGNGFQLVDNVEDADMVIKLSTGATVDNLCAPLNTQESWSCRNGSTVVVNYNRWAFGTPTFAGFSLKDYRSYLINHEGGHWLGMGHIPCPAPGEPGPIMLQQSISLGGCKANIWPAASNYR